MHTIVWEHSATRDFDSLPNSVRISLDRAISRLAQDQLPPQSKALTATAGWYRLRVGNYRVIYTIDQVSNRVIILAIGHRRDVYR